MPLKKQRIEFWKAKNGQWYWRVKARNGKVIDGSEEGHNNRAYVIRKASKRYPDADIQEVPAP